ncbi:MAG: divergent polysaccharide deacetylase family protein [Candidatus Omnitrophica bacterium]|nr:divergent polysaccharide deacetylase family protein [Candidatus Omnitrophota bacterium]
MSAPEDRKKPTKGLRWSLPLILLLTLGILVVVVNILKETRQPPLPERQPAPFREKVDRLKSHLPGFQGKSLAIIIDDVGWSLSLAKELAEIEQPLTLAILPRTPHAAEIASKVRGQRNREILLHLPLEPAPPTVCRDGGLIKVEMTAEEIREEFEENLKAIGQPIEGVNNHMGSLFTTDEEKMTELLKLISEHGFYFIDSLTARNSCGYRLARDLNIPAACRDIFLDNSANPQDIKEQLRLAAEKARKNGRCIAVGHARKDTVVVLKEELPFLEEEGVRLVLVSHLVH